MHRDLKKERKKEKAKRETLTFRKGIEKNKFM